MKITLSGRNYEIGGIAYGTIPAWKLIKEDGMPMTGQSFGALSDLDKQQLLALVQQHIAGLNG